MMLAPRALLAAALLHLAVLPAAASPTAVTLDTDHQDARATAKLRFDPRGGQPSGLAGESRARAFLADRAAELGLPADLAGLRLTGARESLLGTHWTFQQSFGGVDVEGGVAIVSVARADGRVYRVFNDTWPAKAAGIDPDRARGRVAASIGREAAFDAVWNRLRASGEVLSAPSARLAWVPSEGTLRLVWIVDLELDAPYGGWRARVDAATGSVVALEDVKVYREKSGFAAQSVEERIAEAGGPVGDRGRAFARFAARREAFETARSAPASRAAGTGLVFDPDPRTTLNTEALADGSPAGSFTAAYLSRNLLDITLSGGVYRLTGPWCTIINWDPPSTAPSTTVDGNWTATRGNNAFNDAMTYFQIDNNQRYMQSLGFVGAMGIQAGPIGTDTDGANGADNSYYYPSTNRMAFGHGCVDDSEDADVMLHEYGHAINHDINPSWGGGDMGAIGEGFGDYWAGSYSYSTPNGPVFHPEWVFSWDGHNACWSGRVLNAFTAQYVHSSTYGAHQSIPGGWQSDELWSTPCFQSLLELVNTWGRTREEVDTIILESQFGLGGGLKMRDMANAIIQTAGMLYPGGPHAEVFIQKFLVHNIVDVPVVALAPEEIVFSSAGANGAADPGETVTFTVPVTNQGTLGATAVSATLTSSTPGVTVIAGTSAYPDLAPGATGSNATAFQLSIGASHPCGDPVALSLDVDFDDGDPSSTVLNLSMGTGVPQGASVVVNPELSIPDNNATGVTSTLVVSGSGANVTSGFNVDIDLTHTYIGDLLVRLTSPSGTTVILHNRSGGSADDIVGNYPNTLTPAQSLAAFVGQPLDGTWTMFVSDNAGIDTGVLHTWGIHDVTGWDCEGSTTGVLVAGGGTPTSFALQPNRPNPFVESTAIRFAVPDGGGTVDLAVFDIAGRRVRTLAAGTLPAGQHAIDWNGADETGRRVGAGIYFVRLLGESFEATRKVVLLP